MPAAMPRVASTRGKRGFPGGGATAGTCASGSRKRGRIFNPGASLPAPHSRRLNPGRLNPGRLNPGRSSVVIVAGIAATPRINQPPDEDGQQDEGDEPTDEGPVHEANVIRRALSMRRPRALGVQCHLLAGRGKCPGHLPAPLLAEHEPHLTGRPQPVGMVGTVGRARPRVADRAQQILMKKAALAARLGWRCARIRHRYTPLGARCSSVIEGASKRTSEASCNPDFRKTHELLAQEIYLQTADIFCTGLGPPAISVAFRSR